MAYFFDDLEYSRQRFMEANPKFFNIPIPAKPVRCKCPKCGSPNLKAPAPFLDSNDAYLPPDPPLHTMVKCNVCDAFVLPIWPEGEKPATVIDEVKYGLALTVADCYDMPSEEIVGEIRQMINERIDRYFREGR